MPVPKDGSNSCTPASFSRASVLQFLARASSTKAFTPRGKRRLRVPHVMSEVLRASFATFKPNRHALSKRLTGSRISATKQCSRALLVFSNEATLYPAQ